MATIRFNDPKMAWPDVGISRADSWGEQGDDIAGRWREKIDMIYSKSFYFYIIWRKRQKKEISKKNILRIALYI